MDYIPSKLVIYSGRANIDEIKKYYDHTKSAIDIKYDATKNPDYFVDFFGLSGKDVRQQYKKEIIELSIEGGMALLSAAEAAFRVDFITRCRSRKKDPINKDFKLILKKYKQVYEVRIKEDILERWQQEFPAEKHQLSTLKQRFEYRNWLAHGRYWNKFNNAGLDTYSFDSIYLEISNLMAFIGSSLQKPIELGAPIK